MPKLVRGLYAKPREPIGHPEGGLDLSRLVGEAQRAIGFQRLFGESTDVVELVKSAAQRHGWALARAEVLEAMEEFA